MRRLAGAIRTPYNPDRFNSLILEIGVRHPSLPRLVRFLMLHAGIGFAIAGLFTLGLVYANPGGIGTLLAHADWSPLPTILLWFLLGLTCSSCQMGAAVMLLGHAPDDDGHSPRNEPAVSRLCAAVRAGGSRSDT